MTRKDQTSYVSPTFMFAGWVAAFGWMILHLG